MTKRERTLGIAVGALLVVVGGIFGMQRVMSWFDERYDAVASLQTAVEQQKSTINRGSRAERQFREWQARSLPEDQALARSLYLDWLQKRAVSAGLTGLRVSPGPGRQEGKIYQLHTFNVTGDGDLQQLTRFLHDFYSAGYLHRIKSLLVKPKVGQSKDLDLTLSIEALSLTGTPPSKELADVPGNRLAHQDVAAYIDTVVARNLFGPANKPPQITASTQTGNPAQPLTFKVPARDPDSEDKLSYKFEGEPPAGATLDEQSGEFRWTPPALGEYSVSIRVTDDGVPNQSVTGTVKLAIVEAPVAEPPKPGFDPATQAILSGITESAGVPEVWINVKTEGKVLKLRQGDDISVGTVKGKIAEIDLKFKSAKIAADDGGMITVALGKPLVSAETGGI